MINISDVEQKIQNFSNLVNKKKTILEDRLKKLTNKKMENLSAQSKIDLFSKTTNFLNKFSSELRKKISNEIENLVTNALQTSLRNNRYSFKIEFQVKRGTTEAIFCLYDKLNKCLVDIIDSSGGGIADIISTILFFAFLEISASKSDFLIFDEVGKNISSDKRSEFFKLLKKLIFDYRKQIIYVTHQNELVDFADKIIKFESDDNGYVKIS